MEIVVLAFLYALLTGGKLRRLLSCSLKGEWFLVAYVILQIAGRLSMVVQRLGMRGHSYFMMGLYLLLILLLWLNKRLPGIRWMIVGTVLNGAALIFNGGRMPVKPEALLHAGQFELLELLRKGCCTTHELMNPSTKLSFLGDMIPTPAWWFYPRVLSIGDFLIILGLCIFLVKGLKGGCEHE